MTFAMNKTPLKMLTIRTPLDKDLSGVPRGVKGLGSNSLDLNGGVTLAGKKSGPSAIVCHWLCQCCSELNSHRSIEAAPVDAAHFRILFQ